MDLQKNRGLKRGEDLISKLPDDILSHILSRLQTKDAGKTCVLSSRWKDLWTLLYNLDFTYYHDRLFGPSPNFENNFVDKVISRCKSQYIQNFSLTIATYDDIEILSRVAAWISFAIEHKVQSLGIKVSNTCDVEEWFQIRLPQSILTSKTLVELKLCSAECDFTFDIPDSVAFFPCLKILYIDLFWSNSNIMHKLFRGCSILEELTIHGDLEDNENVMTFDITVPTLKTLKIYLLPDLESASMHKFVVRARTLEQLYIDDVTLACFVMDETPFISHASLDGCFSLLSKFEPTKIEANRTMDILRAIKNTKFLSLSEGIMGVLILAFDGNLPIFPNLIKLESGIDAGFGWKLLPYFLNNSPNLEVLILKKEDDEDFPLDRFFYFESENVPSCLLLCVKEIKMIMRGGFDELEVIRYLLKNSKVLEKFLVVFTARNSKVQKYLKYQISRFPMGSTQCKVEFR